MNRVVRDAVVRPDLENRELRTGFTTSHQQFQTGYEGIDGRKAKSPSILDPNLQAVI
jgi:hypothetical protein